MQHTRLPLAILAVLPASFTLLAACGALQHHEEARPTVRPAALVEQAQESRQARAEDLGNASRLLEAATAPFSRGDAEEATFWRSAYHVPVDWDEELDFLRERAAAYTELSLQPTPTLARFGVADAASQAKAAMFAYVKLALARAKSAAVPTTLSPAVTPLAYLEHLVAVVELLAENAVPEPELRAALGQEFQRTVWPTFVRDLATGLAKAYFSRARLVLRALPAGRGAVLPAPLVEAKSSIRRVAAAVEALKARWSFADGDIGVTANERKIMDEEFEGDEPGDLPGL